MAQSAKKVKRRKRKGVGGKPRYSCLDRKTLNAEIARLHLLGRNASQIASELEYADHTSIIRALKRPDVAAEIEFQRTHSAEIEASPPVLEILAQCDEVSPKKILAWCQEVVLTGKIPSRDGRGDKVPGKERLTLAMDLLNRFPETGKVSKGLGKRSGGGGQDGGGMLTEERLAELEANAQGLVGLPPTGSC